MKRMLASVLALAMVFAMGPLALAEELLQAEAVAPGVRENAPFAQEAGAAPQAELDEAPAGLEPLEPEAEQEPLQGAAVEEPKGASTVTITGGRENTDYIYYPDTGQLWIYTGVPLTISGTFAGTINQIKVSNTYPNTVANVTFSNVTVETAVYQTSGKYPQPVTALLLGPGTGLNLTLEGENFLIGKSVLAAVSVPYGTFLTIDGPGSLTVKHSGSISTSAGIGEGSTKDGWGDITINGGTICAQGVGGGAGIGGAGGSHSTAPQCGKIEINGGTVTAAVTAQGGKQGAGIGSGGNTASDTAISQNISSSVIVIRDGEVNATGGSCAAGIGGGENGAAGEVVIAGGTVKAAGGASGSGIGSGWKNSSATEEGHVSKIALVGGTVTAQAGSKNAMDIGKGSGADTAQQIVRTVEATNGTGPARIDDAPAGIVPDGAGQLVVKGDVTLPCDLALGEAETLVVPQGASLAVPESTTLSGKVQVDGALANSGVIEGTVANQGTMTNSGVIEGTVANQGSVANNGVIEGTVDNQGTVTNDGTVKGEVTGDGHYSGNAPQDGSEPPDPGPGIQPGPEPGPESDAIRPDTAVALDKASLMLRPGETAKLKAALTPGNATYKYIFWASSDEAVATVSDSGLVTAVSEGTAIVTAKSWYGHEAVCEVTVKKADVPTPPEPVDPWPTEGLEGFVTRCYRVALSRDPDKAGHADWVRWLQDGTVNAKACTYGFVFSKEMNNKKQSDEDFVKTLYNLFMDREGEATGVAFWTRYLKDGHSRQDVFDGFADSREFAGLKAQYGVK